MTIEVFGYDAFDLFHADGSDPSSRRKRNSLHCGQVGETDLMNRSQIERISKALGDETRLRIFEAISRGRQMSCGEIVLMRGVTPATVSHHLKILSEAGLITCRRDGQFVYSEAVPKTIQEFTRTLAKMARANGPRRR